jgi:hypothetical protein
MGIKNSMLGWVSIHRKVIDKGFYKKPEFVLLWLHLLLKANHKETEIVWNNETIKIKEGSFLTGRKALSAETGINESKIERILKYFENEQQIEQQKTTKFRIIKVKNWTFYQNNKNGEQQIEQQVNNKRTTSEQQVNTDNNDNKENNEKNDNKIPFDVFWDAYDKKVGKPNCEKKWNKLKEETQFEILNHIELYKESQPDKQYRKNPEVYLNNKSWNDEIINRNNGNGTDKPIITENKLNKFAESIWNDPDLK